MLVMADSLNDIQRYYANVGITASALRNLGAPKVVESARIFLAEMDLKPLKSLEPIGYSDWLEKQTQALMRKFPETCRTYWGPARKAVNIFMTMAALSRHLCEAYGLDRLESVMETPLDGIAQKKLRKWAQDRQLFIVGEFPDWKSIKALNKENSDKYQRIAFDVAQVVGTPRGRLDVILWDRNPNRLISLESPPTPKS